MKDEENNLEVVTKEEEIVNLIYTIRGKQVMIDSDVANLYHYETKRINETVNRNKSRFPENFCFQLTKEEYEELNCKSNWSQNVAASRKGENLRSQFGISSEKSLRSQIATLEKRTSNLRSQFATSSSEKENYGGRRYYPYVFTEQGIAMLSGLLKNEIAVQVSINIMNAFVEMRKFIASNGQVFERLTNVEYKLLEHDKKFDKIFNELQEKEEFTQKIFFQGQIYDAYSLIIDIVKRANEKITIIDNYVDKSVLDILTRKNKNVEVSILTSRNSSITKLDIQKFNNEYPILSLAETNMFHDRFIIIDNSELYHLGASIKDLGKKCFGISKMLDKVVLENIQKETTKVNNT